jgi:hypothetical protein
MIEKDFEDFRLPQMWLVLIDSDCGDIYPRTATVDDLTETWLSCSVWVSAY